MRNSFSQSRLPHLLRLGLILVIFFTVAFSEVVESEEKKAPEVAKESAHKTEAESGKGHVKKAEYKAENKTREDSSKEDLYRPTCLADTVVIEDIKKVREAVEQKKKELAAQEADL